MGESTQVRCNLSPETVIELREKAFVAGYLVKKTGQGAASTYAREMVKAALQSERLVMTLSPYFRRAYFPKWDTERVLMGTGRTVNLEGILPDLGDGEKVRFSVKFAGEEYDEFAQVAYALDATESDALAAIIEQALILHIEAREKVTQ